MSTRWSDIEREFSTSALVIDEIFRGRGPLNALIFRRPALNQNEHRAAADHAVGLRIIVVQVEFVNVHFAVFQSLATNGIDVCFDAAAADGADKLTVFKDDHVGSDLFGL